MNDEKKHSRLARWIFLLYFICAVAFYYLGGQQFHSKTLSTGVSVSSAGGVGELVSGVELCQPFSLDAELLRGVMLTSATYGRENDCTLTVSVCRPDGAPLGSQTVSALSLPNGREFTVLFSEPIPVAPLQPLELCISSDGQPGNAIALYYGNSVSLSKGSVEKELSADQLLRKNGEPLDGILCFEVFGERSLLFGRIYWYLAGGFAVLLLVYLLYSDRRYRAGGTSITLRLLSAFQKYQFLLWQLVSRDFKTKYKRSALGMLWSFLNPLLMMLIYLVVFSRLFHSDINNFPAYLIIGIVCFGFFSEATNMCLQSITGNAALITKVYIPKYIYPVSRVVSSSVNLLLSLVPLFLVVLLSGAPIRPQWLLILFGFGCLMLFTLGVGLALAAIMVFFRDTQFLWGICITVLNFLTPIFYPESIIQARFLPIFKMNPLYHIIRFIRIVLIDGVSPEPKAYLFCLLASCIPLLLGAAIFKKTQDRFVLHI